VSATGIDWIFAPTVAVALWTPDGGERMSRTVPSLRYLVTFAGGIVEAMQGVGIVATAKHFLGDGGTFRGIDQGDTRLDKDSLLSIHGQGYYSAIEAGVADGHGLFQ